MPGSEETLDLFEFEAAGQAYALPLHAVDRVEPFAALSPIPDVPPVVAGLLDLHGAALPVFDLRRRIEGQRGEYGLDAKLIIGHTATRRFAVAASDVRGVTVVSKQHLEALEQLLPGAGTLPLVVPATEGMIFVYDPDAFLKADEQAQLDAALEERGG